MPKVLVDVVQKAWLEDGREGVPKEKNTPPFKPHKEEHQAPTSECSCTP